MSFLNRKEQLLFEKVYVEYANGCDGIDRVPVCEEEFYDNEWQDEDCMVCYLSNEDFMLWKSYHLIRQYLRVR